MSETVYFAFDEDVTAIADAIRDKSGTSDPLAFPDDFVDAIEQLPYADESDATATAGDIRSGKSAYVNHQKVTGNMETETGTTYGVNGSDRTITGGKYLDGNIVIKGVTTSNIDAANIKSGVVVKVGDSTTPGAIKNVTGTYSGTGTTWTGVSGTFPSSQYTVPSGARYIFHTIEAEKVNAGIRNIRITGNYTAMWRLASASSDNIVIGLLGSSTTGNVSANSCTFYYEYCTR